MATWLVMTDHFDWINMFHNFAFCSCSAHKLKALVQYYRRTTLICNISLKHDVHTRQSMKLADGKLLLRTRGTILLEPDQNSYESQPVRPHCSHGFRITSIRYSRFCTLLMFEHVNHSARSSSVQWHELSVRRHRTESCNHPHHSGLDVITVQVKLTKTPWTFIASSEIACSL